MLWCPFLHWKAIVLFLRWLSARTIYYIQAAAHRATPSKVRLPEDCAYKKYPSAQCMWECALTTCLQQHAEENYVEVQVKRYASCVDVLPTEDA
jgi:hypothetical protein